MVEHQVRHVEATSAAWDNASQVELDGLRAKLRDACAAAEEKGWLAKANVQPAQAILQ